MNTIQQVWALLECLPSTSPFVGNDGEEDCPRLNGLLIWEEADRRVAESLTLPVSLREEYTAAFASLQWEAKVVIDREGHWSNSFSHESDSWKREWVAASTHTEFTPILDGWVLPHQPRMAWSKEISLASLLLEVWNDLFAEEKKALILATWQEWLDLASQEAAFSSKEERLQAERAAEKAARDARMEAARHRMEAEAKAKAKTLLPSGKPKPVKKRR